MKNYFVVLVTFLCAFLCAQVCFAYDNTGFIPDTLAWFTDTIVEQWTLTENKDSETFEQIHYSRNTNEIDGENDFVPISQRFNRRLVVTMGFINLGTKVYSFDNSSRLETFINQKEKKIVADAVPMASKTVIAPNGRVKKSAFIIKMNKRSFVDAFDNRYGIGALIINPFSGKLLIEDSEGNSLLDEVDDTPGFITFISLQDMFGPKVYFPFDKKYTLKDILIILNRIEEIKNPGNKFDFFEIKNDEIVSVLGVQNSIDNNLIVLFTLNKKAVDNSNTSKTLAESFGSDDKFRIAIMPLTILHEYLPGNFYAILFRMDFKETIAQLPESIAPKKYQEVNNAGSLKESYRKLKEFAESGDNEAIEVIFKRYDPKKHDDILYELFPDSKSYFLWLKQLADKGYSQAQLGVGLFYENSVIVKENLDKALKYYKLAAEQDNDDAMVCCAKVLLRIDKNKYFDEIIEWYRKAAERKNPHGQFMLALMLMTSQDDEQKKEGIKWLQQSADGGFPDAMYALALEYVFGRYVPKDDKKAFALMEKAAIEKGLPKAIDVLGDFYMRGIGVEPDGKRAVLCYSIGAKRGAPNSMYWYGRFLCDGFNVDKDVSKGYALIKEAATKGNAEAMLFLGLDYYIGNIAIKNDKEAFFWIEKAVNAGNKSAIVVLGDFYMEGVGVVANQEKAVELYKKSAAQKDPLGIFRVGQILYEAKGADTQTGLNLIKVAAKMGNKSAQDYLDNLDDLNNDDNDFEDNNDIDDIDEEDPFE